MSIKNSKVNLADHTLAGLQVHLLQDIRNGIINLEDLKWFLGLSQKDLANYRGVELSVPVLPTTTSYLRLISGGHNLVISACDGGRSLAYSKTFTEVHGGAENWKLDIQSVAEEISVLVYEMCNEDGDFQMIYNSFGVDKKTLAFKSQEQIEKFVMSYISWFRTDGYGTFFLFTKEVNYKEEFFVADVRFVSNHPGHLSLLVHKLSEDSALLEENRHRFVIPVIRSLEN